MEEGARFQFLAQPAAVLGNAAGEVTGIRCIRMELDQPDGAGRLSVKPVLGTEFEIPADVVLIAYGFVAPKLPASDDFAKLTVNGSGCLLVTDSMMTNLSGVFGVGSIVHGAAPLSDVVRDARKAAEAIDAYLKAHPKNA